MPETGGLDIGAPGEGAGKASETLSEEAKQRFSASAAAMQQIRREEKKSKKRDDRVAQMIIRFLGNQQDAHLFTLIARLVARDCPSIFILAVISLIDEESLKAVEDYLKETTGKESREMIDENTCLMKSGKMDSETNRQLITWITRLQMVISADTEKILFRIMIDEKNIDGTVLQLSTFVLQRFFLAKGKSAEFGNLQPLTASILQAVFEPFMRKKYLR